MNKSCIFLFLISKEQLLNIFLVTLTALARTLFAAQADAWMSTLFQSLRAWLVALLPITGLAAQLCALVMWTLPFAFHPAWLARLVALPGTVTVLAEVVARFHAGGTSCTTGEVADVPADQEASTLAGALDVQETKTALSASSCAIMLALQAGFTRSWAWSGVGVDETWQLDDMTARELLRHSGMAFAGARVRTEILAVVTTWKLLGARKWTQDR